MYIWRVSIAVSLANSLPFSFSEKANIGLSPSKKKFICFNDSPLKMMKNAFLSHLNSSFHSQDI